MDKKFNRVSILIVFCVMLFILNGVVPAMAAVTTVKSGFGTLIGIALDNNGNIIVTDYSNNKVNRISSDGSTVTELGAGNFNRPRGVAVDSNNNIYVGDVGSNSIKKISSDGTVSTIKTDIVSLKTVAFLNGKIHYASWNDIYKMDLDGANAEKLVLNTTLAMPTGLAKDASDNLYIADNNHNRVLKIGTDGSVTELITDFLYASSVAVDSNNNVYTGNQSSIRKIDANGGMTTLINSNSTSITLDNNDNIYFCSTSGNVYKSGLPQPASITSVSVSPTTADVVQGGTQQLTETVTVVGGAAQTVTWTSSDVNNKVTVNGGLVNVAADAATGNYMITATSTVDGTKFAAGTITVTAPLAPTYTATLSQTGTDTFTAQTEGYSPVTAQSVTVTKTGTGDITNLAVALSGPNASSFTLGTLGATTLNSTTTSTVFTVKPKDGLSAGTYIATVTATADHDVNKTFVVWFTVSAAISDQEQAAPTGLGGVAPTAALTDGKITGTTLAMEYKLASAADSTYAICTAPNTTVAVAGDYVVRLAAKPGFNAGTTAPVTVPAYVAPNHGSSWGLVGSVGFSAGSVDSTSIAIDGSGTPYVVYRDGGNSNKATVMKYNGSSWESVGSAGFSADFANFTSIAINGSSSTPYVVYLDGGNNNKATVMKYNGSSWESVGSAGFSAGEAAFTSIAIDGSGTPYVVYRDGTNNNKATVMKYNGTNWVSVGSAGFSAGLAGSTRIAIDRSSGTPYVVYQDGANNNKATVMKYNGTNWVSVGSAGFSAGQADTTRIAIDSSGTPYVVYTDYGNSYKATVMKYNGSSWVSVGSAGLSAGMAGYTSIVLDSSSGTPYVVYSDNGNGFKATVMKYDGSSWVSVGSAGFSAGLAGNTDIAIDGSGTPYVVYRDGRNNDKTTVMKYVAAGLSSIAITIPATKLNYTVGDALDLSGLVVTGTNSDNTTQEEPVTPSNVTGFNSAAPAVGQTLTITIAGKTTTYTVDVLPAPTAYTLTYTAGAHGTLTGIAAQTVNSGTTGSAITAVPDAGYHFVSWSDGATTATRTESNVISNLEVTANFAVDETPAPTIYTLTYAAGPNGTLTGIAAQSVTSGTTGSAITAVPDAGYHFVNWSDGGTTATRTESNVVSNLNVTAIFAVTGGSGGGGGSKGSVTPTPTTETVTGEVIGETGQVVSGISVQVSIATDGTSTVAVKSSEAVLMKQPDGTQSTFSDTSKLGFTVEGNTTTNTEVIVTLSADGTIQVKNLANGTESKIAVTYDLGNGQKISIGIMDIKVGSDGKISLTSTLIDPYGIITDAATGTVITGANVTLYYANTARNIAAGKTPDTLVELPIIEGFKPNNNKNPQISDLSGAYGFMVFPTSDYYIVATNDGYDQFRSPTISVEQDIVKFDFKMNQPKLGLIRLAGLNRVDTALEIAKANYTGQVSNVILATAENFPDALAGSVLAYKLNAPILLVGSTEEDQTKVITYMKDHLNTKGTVYILGGTAVVSDAVREKVTVNGFANITRLGGYDRYETALKIAEALDTKTGTPIILAYGENYPDALSISSVAAAMQYPILLVGNDGISDAVKKKIADINPIKVYIIGGKAVISTLVEDQVSKLTSLDKGSIIRLGGVDRFETSLAVAKYFNLSGQNICVATGNNFPDALTGSVYAANSNAPIILSDDNLSEDAITYLKTRKSTGVTIFGGEAVISKAIEQELSQMFSK